jgi:hypothetical protein
VYSARAYHLATVPPRIYYPTAYTASAEDLVSRSSEYITSRAPHPLPCIFYLAYTTRPAYTVADIFYPVAHVTLTDNPPHGSSEYIMPARIPCNIPHPHMLSRARANHPTAWISHSILRAGTPPRILSGPPACHITTLPRSSQRISWPGMLSRGLGRAGYTRG